MPRSTPIAIVGMEVLLPGAPDLATYWRNLVAGFDAITDVPSGRWGGDYYAPGATPRADRIACNRGGFVDDQAEVDITGLGIMPSSVPGTEPDQLIALHVAAKAIADAGGDDRLPGDRQRAGVVLGRGGYLTPGLVRLDQRVRTATQLVRTLGELMPELGADQLDRVRQAFSDELGPETPESAIGLVPNLAASRLANRLDLRGPAYTVDAACASSLVAVDHAVRELESGRCDLMLAGGTHHCHDITFWSVFSQLGALSPSQRIRPFDARADGLLIGEGTGVVVLKRLADAERDGDRIYAVITGTGISSDGRTASLVNPDSGGQARAIRQAWEAAGLDPATDRIGLLEAHGTATPAGDGAELATIAEVFGQPEDPAEPRAVIGSVKSMIGHTMPAAGVAGLVKAALAVYHGMLLPTLHCAEPNPALGRTRFAPLAEARPWESTGEPVRRAGVNAFGFGGVNAHVVLEQATTRPAIEVREPERVLKLAAPSPEALAALLDAEDTEVLAKGSEKDTAGPVRLGIVDPTPKRLALARKAVAKGRGWRGRNDVWFVPRPLLGQGGGKLAFVFPGLEAESPHYPVDVARRFGLPLPSTEDVHEADVGRRGKGVFELGRLLDTALRRMNVAPDALAGHSLGEWTAMAAAGIHAEAEVEEFLAGFDPDELVVPGLVFAAVGAPAEEVLGVLADRPDVVLSHDNAPRQAMICGTEDGVAEVVGLFRDRAVIAQVLPFRSGFHTPMLEPYLGPIVAAADRYSLHPARLPVWSATTTAPYPSAPEDVRALFVRHLLEPVRFRPMIEAMHAAGFRAFVQLGAGKLGSLVGDTLHGEAHLAVSAHSAHRSGLAQLRRVVTALWADGAEPDASPLPSVATRRPVRLDLGSPLVSLGEGIRAEIGASRRPSAEAAFPALDSFGERSPVAAELSALLKDTAELAVGALAARRSPASRGTRPLPREPVPPAAVRTTLRVSTETMPYLLDHCFFKQPAGADPADSWPVLPGTTVIAHLMDFAGQAAPGRHAVTVRDVRLGKWITAIPATELTVSIDPEGANRVSAALGEHARAVVELASGYPRPPEPWTIADDEREPGMTAADLYRERWMFHGPRFQGVTELTAIGDAHVRGVLTTPDAPGALLDNAGQLLGYWIMSRLPSRTTVFPVGMGEIRFHGPHPVPGEKLDCLVRVTEVTDAELVADVQFVRDGRVWAEVTGWRDRRFDSDASIERMAREPERNTLSDARPGGWELVHERWPDLATRELIMRNVLAGAEREQYANHPPRGRRQWLLGRIAAKDAVRRLLWERGEDGVFPAEVRIHDEAGGPRAAGAFGRRLPELTVSLAHCAEAGVAMARRGRCGIHLDEVVSANGTALGAVERVLLAAAVRDGTATEDRWFARFRAAKEAAAKASGSEARDAEVVFVDGTSLIVRALGRHHRVSTQDVANPPGLPAREYVVAWTEHGESEGDRN
ncbi:beta-ketoacyl synthase N-terminal-like domain-containing protein [Amycolatopsis minnesotensis]|uniref:Type I polyketide synthase n=1 Tax=Amycolatopsis minnesotensis TaxID=337894 RepID=A0ABN2R6Z0_9PSEU